MQGLKLIKNAFLKHNIPFGRQSEASGNYFLRKVLLNDRDKMREKCTWELLVTINYAIKICVKLIVI